MRRFGRYHDFGVSRRNMSAEIPSMANAATAPIQTAPAVVIRFSTVKGTKNKRFIKTVIIIEIKIAIR